MRAAALGGCAVALYWATLAGLVAVAAAGQGAARAVAIGLVLFAAAVLGGAAVFATAIGVAAGLQAGRDTRDVALDNGDRIR